MTEPMTVAAAKAHITGIDGCLADEAGMKAKVAASFAALDVDGSGCVDRTEGRRLVRDLCVVMGLPPPSDAEIRSHFDALDRNNDSLLSVQEVGEGVFGALLFKRNSLQFYVDRASAQGLADGDALPTDEAAAAA